MVYVFPRNIFLERYGSDDPFLTAVNDFTLSRIEKSKPTLGLAEIIPEIKS